MSILAQKKYTSQFKEDDSDGRIFRLAEDWIGTYLVKSKYQTSFLGRMKTAAYDDA